MNRYGQKEKEVHALLSRVRIAAGALSQEMENATSGDGDPTPALFEEWVQRSTWIATLAGNVTESLAAMMAEGWKSDIEAADRHLKKILENKDK